MMNALTVLCTGHSGNGSYFAILVSHFVVFIALHICLRVCVYGDIFDGLSFKYTFTNIGKSKILLLLVGLIVLLFRNYLMTYNAINISKKMYSVSKYYWRNFVFSSISRVGGFWV